MLMKGYCLYGVLVISPFFFLLHFFHVVVVFVFFFFLFLLRIFNLSFDGISSGGVVVVVRFAKPMFYPIQMRDQCIATVVALHTFLLFR